MKYLVIISTLFVIGSLLGWVIELLFRRFVSQKKWMNPGFLTGPYLPIYACELIPKWILLTPYRTITPKP